MTPLSRLALILSFSVALPAGAATIPVAPGGEAAAVVAAQGGDVLAFAGAFDHVTVNGKVASPPVSLDFTASTVANLRIQNSDGLTIVGGHWTPTDWLGAIYVANSKNIAISAPMIEAAGHGGVFLRDDTSVSVTNAKIDGASVAIALYGTGGYLLQGNTLLNMAIDGIDLYGSSSGKVAFNACAGAFLLDQHHPDCVQIALVKPYAPPADIEIANNLAFGASQGFSGFDHGTGGFDRINIHDNTMALTYPQGVSINACRACSVTNNHATTLPGATFRTSINANPADSPGLIRCGNTVAAGAGKAAADDAPCPAR